MTADEILSMIHQRWPLERIPARTAGEVATRYRYLDGQGEIGIIASVTKPFCGGCTRVRMSSDGQLYTCLFGEKGHDVRAWLRSGLSDDEILERIVSVWTHRNDRYSEVRTSETAHRPRVEMSKIGG